MNAIFQCTDEELELLNKSLIYCGKVLVFICLCFDIIMCGCARRRGFLDMECHMPNVSYIVCGLEYYWPHGKCSASADISLICDVTVVRRVGGAKLFIYCASRVWCGVMANPSQTGRRASRGDSGYDFPGGGLENCLHVQSHVIRRFVWGARALPARATTMPNRVCINCIRAKRARINPTQIGRKGGGRSKRINIYWREARIGGAERPRILAPSSGLINIKWERAARPRGHVTLRELRVSGLCICVFQRSCGPLRWLTTFECCLKNFHSGIPIFVFTFYNLVCRGVHLIQATLDNLGNKSFLPA